MKRKSRKPNRPTTKINRLQQLSTLCAISKLDFWEVDSKYNLSRDKKLFKVTIKYF